MSKHILVLEMYSLKTNGILDRMVEINMYSLINAEQVLLFILIYLTKVSWNLPVKFYQ